MEAVVDAEGLGACTRRGPVFSDVTFRAGQGDVVAVAGPGGSGRTSLLLAVAARLRTSAGSLRVCGLPVTGGSRSDRTRVRALAAVARATGAAEPEPELRVRDHVRERRLATPDASALPEDLLGFDLPDDALVRDLPPEAVTGLALALALTERPALIVLDDLDQGTDHGTQRELWRTVRRAADTGATVLASTTDAAPAAGIADTVVLLGGR